MGSTPLEFADDLTLEEFGKLVEEFSPEKMDFGKAPTTPLSHVVDLAKTLNSKTTNK